MQYKMPGIVLLNPYQFSRQITTIKQQYSTPALKTTAYIYALYHFRPTIYHKNY